MQGCLYTGSVPDFRLDVVGLQELIKSIRVFMFQKVFKVQAQDFLLLLGLLTCATGLCVCVPTLPGGLRAILTERTKVPFRRPAWVMTRPAQT